MANEGFWFNKTYEVIENCITYYNSTLKKGEKFQMYISSSHNASILRNKKREIRVDHLIDRNLFRVSE